jgi:hypothetical protein
MFARFHGFRDYQKKLRCTPRTLLQIASNTAPSTVVATRRLTGDALGMTPTTRAARILCRKPEQPFAYSVSRANIPTREP